MVLIEEKCNYNSAVLNGSQLMHKIIKFIQFCYDFFSFFN